MQRCAELLCLFDAIQSLDEILPVDASCEDLEVVSFHTIFHGNFNYFNALVVFFFRVALNCIPLFCTIFSLIIFIAFNFIVSNCITFHCA